MKNFLQKFKIQAEDEEYMTDTKAAMLGKSTFFAHSILYTLLALIVFGLIWAYFSTVEKITIGDGKVTPSSQVKIIQNLDGGIVSEILVKEGELVKKGQVLMRLDDTRYKADYQEHYTKYLVLLAITSRLKAEAYGDPQINFPDILLKEQPALVTRETKQFETRRNTLREELSLLEHSYALAQQQIQMYYPLVEKGTVSRVDLLKSQQSADAIQRDILEKRNTFSKDAWEEYNKQNADLALEAEQLKILKDKMLHTTIVSPVHGIVKKLNIVTIGGVITPGLNIMEIVPIEDTLLIEAKIKPKDIAFIKIGQPADVRITAYDYTIYGSLPGKVEYISPDAIEETNRNAMPGENIYYEVDIRTNKNYLGGEKQKLAIMPGMGAVVHITTGEHSVLNYILKPIYKAKEEALRER